MRTIHIFRNINHVALLMILVMLIVTAHAQGSKVDTVSKECVERAAPLPFSQLNKLILKRFKPEDPGLIDKGKLQGFVTVEVCVSEQGKVEFVHALEGSPIAFQPVIESVKQWKFRVYKSNGVPHAFSGIIKVNFNFSLRH